ncbi:hypothetical protein EV426DRAFT_680934 [Tirmania nivea]|nr:hypothetical protein EV426DRAFT_680934 [Tirmania nivea]
MLDFKKYPTQSRVLLRSTLISSGLRHPHYSSHGQLPRIGYFAPKFSPTEELAYQIELAAFVGVGTEWRLPLGSSSGYVHLVITEAVAPFLVQREKQLRDTYLRHSGPDGTGEEKASYSTPVLDSSSEYKIPDWSFCPEDCSAYTKWGTVVMWGSLSIGGISGLGEKGKTSLIGGNKEAGRGRGGSWVGKEEGMVEGWGWLSVREEG